MYWGWGFWGMSAIWWLFWVAVIVIFFSLATPMPRSRIRQMRETPLDILRRRYASGELTSEEFDERKRRLEGDGAGPTAPHPPAANSPPSQPLHH